MEKTAYVVVRKGLAFYVGWTEKACLMRRLEQSQNSAPEQICGGRGFQIEGPQAQRNSGGSPW